MTRSLLALTFIAWILCFARGWVRRLLPRDPLDRLIVPLTTAGLGLGLVTLLVFWLLLLSVGPRAFPIAFATMVAVFVTGRSAMPRAARATDHHAETLVLPWDPLGLTLCVALLLCCAGVVFNAIYWPFDIGDALAIYAPFGKDLYTDARLPAGHGLYESYPMLVPIAYALTHWAAGSVNEYLARLVPALMAIGTIGAAGALGWQLRSPRTGLVGASLVALTPIYGRWASSGYTDVPAAFYVGLSALFACRWETTGGHRDLALAGTFAGLALWTKNSVVTLVPTLILVVLWRHLVERRPGAEPRKWWRDIALALGPLSLVAAPWYARNWWLYGAVVPISPWFDRAQHTLESLAVMIRADRHFGVSGWCFTAALPYGLVRLLGNRREFRDRWFVLLAYAGPFLAVWWWAASYESRFLMAIIPILATMAAVMVDDAATAAELGLTRARRNVLALAAAAATAAMTLLALRQTVEHKTVLVHGMRLDDAAKHRVRVGGLYDLAVALNALPAGSRVTGVPDMARYHLNLNHFANVDWTPRDGPPGNFSGRYDYVAYRPADRPAPSWETMHPVILKTDDGYALFSTRVDRRASDSRTLRPE